MNNRHARAFSRKARNALLETQGVPPRASIWRLVLGRLVRNPGAMAGTIVFSFFLLMAFIGPWVVPYEYQAQDISNRLKPPGADHFFGTDQYGRDIFSRILVGSRGIFLLAGSGTLLAGMVGIALGLLSGYVGGIWDEILMRILDIFLAFPPLLLALVILASVGPALINLVMVVAILYVPVLARVTRSMVLDIKTKEFVAAAITRGEGRTYILFHEILPNAYAPLLVELSMRFAYGIFLVASLGFLGLGVQPPSPDWGLQINEARSFFSRAPWMLLFPAAAISLLVVATNLMTDGLRSILHPDSGAN
ncbi:MAG: ABC transporter permease [Desulfobacterales bacterium]|jgi:peptide/nickel transport system permease protein